MTKNKKTGLWIVALLVIALGIAGTVLYFNPKKALKFVFPDLDQISLVKAKIKNDTAYLKIEAIMENKSFYTLTIDTLFYQVTLADSLIFSQTTALKLRQKKYEASNVELPLKLPIKTIMHTIRSLQKQDSTQIEAKIYVVYNTIFGSTKVPFTKVTKIKVPTPPEIKLEKMEMNKFSLKDETVDAVAHVKIINRGDMLDLNIHEIQYELTLGKKLITSHGVFNSPVTIKPRTTTDLDIPVVIHINKPFKVAYMVATNNDKVPYKIILKAELDENNIYKKDDIPLQIEAEGQMELMKKKEGSKKEERHRKKEEKKEKRREKHK